MTCVQGWLKCLKGPQNKSESFQSNNFVVPLSDNILPRLVFNSQCDVSHFWKCLPIRSSNTPFSPSTSTFSYSSRDITETCIINTFNNKIILKNTTLSEQFQNPIEQSQKEAKSILGHTNTCPPTRRAWYRHLSNKWC
jgi:hypothetical protein